MPEQCYDGVRKKAKYLHDAPPEALINSHGAAAFTNLPGFQHVPSTHAQRSDIDMGQPDVYGRTSSGLTPSGFQTYQSDTTSSGMPPPPIETQGILPIAQSRQSSASSAFDSAQTSPMQQLAPTSNQLGDQSGATAQYMSSIPDPTSFNFDLSGMNFGNHYGALEFGMLEHMTTGTQQDPMNTGQQAPSNGFTQPSYNAAPFASQPYIMPPTNVWATTQDTQTPVQNGLEPSFEVPLQRTNEKMPNTFTIGVGNSSSSDNSNGSPPSSGDVYKNSEATYPPTTDRSPPKLPTSMLCPIAASPRLANSATPTAIKGPSNSLHKLKPGTKSPPRPAPASIYRNVTTPYPYTEAFHQFFKLCYRFRKEAVRRIAEALSRIRPSFISAAKTLVPEDLVFMEQYFQRSLLEYEGLLSKCGTPTIVCRRSGEVALSTKEFQVLAGWTPDVLLGREPNLNTNTSSAKGEEASSLNGSNVPTASGKSGFNTPIRPRTPADGNDDTRRNPRKNQPVFLAELLDEQSVVKFYEDFARVAFADSKGTVSSPCKLLRYQPPNEDITGSGGRQRKGKAVKSEEPVVKVEGEEEARKLDEDGKVNCMYCWMVKRDVFNIPMVIVINVSVPA